MLYQIIEYIFVEFQKEFSILSLVDGPSKLGVKIVFFCISFFDGPTSKHRISYYFDGPTSKHRISAYNDGRNQKLGSTELYGNIDI